MSGPSTSMASHLPAFAAVVAVLSCVSLAVYAHAIAPILPEDDGFITMRYAHNAVLGRGLVYNEGEYIFGVSTPSFLAWVTALRMVSSHHVLPELVVRSNVVWLATASVAVGWLIQALSRSRWVAVVGVCTTLVHPKFLDISTGAMEGFLFVTVVLAALAAMASTRVRWAALAVGIAVITRPEGLLLGMIYGVWWLRSGGRDRVAVAIAAGPLVAWCGLAGWYFGSPWPHSLVAKATPLYLTSRADNALTLLGVFVRAVMPSSVLEEYPGVAVPLAVGVLIFVGYLVARRLVLCRWDLAWPGLIFLVALLGLYSQPGMVLFPWYEPILLSLGLCFVLATVGHWYTGIHARWAVVVAMVTAMGLMAMAGGPWRPGLPVVHIDAYRLRVVGYAQAVWGVDARDGADLSIMAAEIGAIGYYHQGVIFDTAGLVSPQAIPHLPVPLNLRAGPAIGAIPLAYVLQEQPDLIMALAGYVDKTLTPSASFHEVYQLKRAVPLPLPRTTGDEVLIFRRRESILPSSP